MELLSAAKDAESIAPANSPLDVLKCTYLATENGKLTVAASNSEVALERRIPADIHEEGRMVIGADLLTAMLKLLDGDTVSIQSEGTCFAVSVSEEEKRPEMKCVHLVFSDDGLHAVGSDGYRIASARGDNKAVGDVDMLIPAASLEKLAQLVTNKDTFNVGTTGKTIVFMKEDFAFSARLVGGQYFDADQLLSRAKPIFSVLTDAELMKQTLSAVYSVTGKQNRFSLTFGGQKLQMRFESEFGISSVEMDVIPLSGTPAGEYWYNPIKLMECLRAQNGALVLEVVQSSALSGLAIVDALKRYTACKGILANETDSFWQINFLKTGCPFEGGIKEVMLS